MKYRKDMCQIAKDAMAEGFSKEAAAGKLGIRKSTLYEWINSKPDFSDAIEAGEALSQQWWEDKGRAACQDGQINATVWSMNMKNRFGWTDKQQVSGPDGGAIQVEHKLLDVIGVKIDGD